MTVFYANVFCKKLKKNNPPAKSLNKKQYLCPNIAEYARLETYKTINN